MNDWISWLSSNETRVAFNILEEAIEELKELISDGSHIQEKSTEKIALDYTYSLGQLDGMRVVIQMLKDIQEIDDDRS